MTLNTYSEGTVSVENDSPVVRLNTEGDPIWLPPILADGDDIVISDGAVNVLYVVETNDGWVDDAYQLTLTQPYGGSTHAARAYTIRNVSLQRQTARQIDAGLATLIATLGTDASLRDKVLAASENLAELEGLDSIANLLALADLDGAANMGAYFTGAGALALHDLTAKARAILALSDNEDILEEIGVLGAFQPLSESLSEIATDSTAFGRALLALANGGEFYGGLGEIPNGQLPARVREGASVSANLNNEQSGWCEATSDTANRPPWASAIRSHCLTMRSDGTVYSQFYVDRGSGGFVSFRSSQGGAEWRRLSAVRGANANGEFVRLPDGTQICWGPAISVGTPTANGSALFVNSADQEWLFPAEFSAPPTGGFYGVRTSGQGVQWATNLNTSWSSVRAVFRPLSTFATNVADYFGYAVGRWLP